MIKKTSSNKPCGRDSECKMMRFYSPSVYNQLHLMRGSKKFYQMGSNYEVCFLFCFFKLIRGETIQIPQKADHHWPASEAPFNWRFAGVPMMAQR